MSAGFGGNRKGERIKMFLKRKLLGKQGQEISRLKAEMFCLDDLNKSLSSKARELNKEVQVQRRMISGFKKQLKKMHALKTEVRDLRAEVLRARQALETAYSNYANLCDTYEETQKDNLRLAESHIALENELKALSVENGRLKAYDSLLNSAKNVE